MGLFQEEAVIAMGLLHSINMYIHYNHVAATQQSAEFLRTEEKDSSSGMREKA